MERMIKKISDRETDTSVLVVPYAVASKLVAMGYEIDSRYCYVCDLMEENLTGIRRILGPYDRGAEKPSIDLEKFSVISAPSVEDFLGFMFNKGMRISLKHSVGIFWHIDDRTKVRARTKVVSAFTYKALMNSLSIYAIEWLELKEKNKHKENENSRNK